MPNWCTNVLKIEGNITAVAAATSRIINEEGQVDFGLVNPMPVEMKGAFTF